MSNQGYWCTHTLKYKSVALAQKGLLPTNQTSWAIFFRTPPEVIWWHQTQSARRWLWKDVSNLIHRSISLRTFHFWANLSFKVSMQILGLLLYPWFFVVVAKCLLRWCISSSCGSVLELAGAHLINGALLLQLMQIHGEQTLCWFYI